ncbi:MAG: hypothetical protein HUU15_18115 [Candidatus Brocadiae bacterium]|nr:hypothetical protein [Candidatus Brocadiia bacterium]
MIRALAFVLALAAAAHAGPRSTLRVRPEDRSIGIRAPGPRAVLEVRAHGDAVPAATVQAGEDGVWRLDPRALPAAGILVAGGEVLHAFESAPPGGGAAPDPGMIEAGAVAIELAVPGGAGMSPADCSLILEHPSASIRQVFAAADLVVSGEGPDARVIFTGWIAPDQCGATSITLATPAGTRSWGARVWSWRWIAERPAVARGATARFRLEVDGLAEGAVCEVVLESPPHLVLEEIPPGCEPSGPGRWKLRTGGGTFGFRTTVEGRADVTADCAPCAR